MKSSNDEIAMPVKREEGDYLGNRQPQPMVVRLEQIHPYERNPRQGTNPEYDRIKARMVQIFERTV